MAAEFKIGRLRYNWAGAWTSGNIYARDNVIQYQGQAYVCLVPNTASTNFYNDLNASPYPYWQLMMVGHTFAGAWTTNTLYSINNLVLFQGTVYTCITAHTSSIFSADVANWLVYVQSDSWTGAWTPNTTYAVGALATYGGVTYECETAHVSAATTALGLEANQQSWSVWYNGVVYAGPWQQGTRYKTNDLVKVDSNVYICVTGHTSEVAPFTGSVNWNIYIPGQKFSLIWSSATAYQLNDAVVYGGNAYISLTANNINNNPSTANSSWGAFNQGYSYQGAWSSGTAYKIGSLVTRNGMLYESIADSPAGQDPAVYVYPVSTTYTAAGSSGLTLKVASTSGILPGMYVDGAGFSLEQRVSVVVDSVTLTLDKAPDGTVTNSQPLFFNGDNSPYWTILNSGKQWLNRWASGRSYVIGDVVVWGNGTYTCIKNHTSQTDILLHTSNRPDSDTNTIYWVLLVAHDRQNALNTYGDIETYNANIVSPIAIGANSEAFWINPSGPNPIWHTLNIVPAVYYVDVNNGIDQADYGTTWDQPWKTIKYSCNYIGQGQYYPNATALLQANKGWLITEMYQWMVYQCNNNIAPFSTTSLFDPFYTQRDAGYIIDALVYDMQRGGNSQMVAATLQFFYYGSKNILANSLIEAAIAYFPPSLTYLQTLINAIMNGTTGSITSYQTLNGITGSAYVSPNTLSNLTAETGSLIAIPTLMSIVITALTNQNTYAVPSSNSGLTAVLYVKTGTYNESLPIVVPENLSIVGDELRSVTVQPATRIIIYCKQTIASNSRIIVSDVSQLTDQMPLQFISPFINNAPTTFGNVVSGKTYYVIGSSINLLNNSVQLADNPTINITGTTVNGSNTISNVSNISNLSIGMNITGPGIPAATTVTAFSQAISGISTVTISNAATASGIYQGFIVAGNLVSLTDGLGNMLVYAGDCLKNMWLMRNGTTMRNLTNFGLLGTLTQTNTYGTARPTGGAYTSLDPGNGPDDTSAWIIRRSPYIQNVTNFGDGCVGTKIDGTLHNGGTRAMLHNDYTQVVSDGIGVWCTAKAITECVSVFSYYNYIGHFAENGGRIRSTNGNSSYGIYGVVSEGFDSTEIPISGTVFNQSTQVQAAVESAFGSVNQLLKLNYSNAGSAYYLPATNMVRYSNNFIATWTNDGNVTFIKNEVAPTGYTEAWLLTGSGNTPGTGYIQQSVNINPTGATYTSVSGATQGGASGNGALFDITVTSTAYVVVVHSGNPGTLYGVGNTILIKGSVLGGVDGTNDLLLTVGSLTGTGILSLSSVTGIVPTGSAKTYTLSMYVYAGTSQTIDIQGIFSGSTTVTSGISYNVTSNVVTPYSGQNLTNSLNGGSVPLYYGAQKTLVQGWYRVWLSVSDPIGTNNILTFKFFPQGANSPIANTYSIIYGAQLELAGSTPPPDFYLETTSSMFTAYANYEVVGAGAGALLSGDETRSGSVFQARVVTDINGYTGGSGYATGSNTAQTGNSYSIQISNADPGLYNYLGMRLFIQAGTGAGQYGYISYYNSGSVTDSNGIASKTALILKEEVEPATITTSTYSATAANNLFTLSAGTDLSKWYVNQPVQFIPTYYVQTVTNTSVATVTAIATNGGTDNTIQVTDASPLLVNMTIVFSGSGFNITAGYVYYIVSIDYVNNLIQISDALYGTPVQLSTVLAGVSYMPLTYARYSGWLNAPGATTTTLNVTSITSTSGVFGGTGFNLTYGQQVSITGAFSSGSIVGYRPGTTYYVIGSPTSTAFQLSATYPQPGMISPTPITTTVSSGTITGITVTSNTITTGNMLPNIPIQFTGIALGGVTLGSTYYVNDIIDSNTFTISPNLISLTSTASTGGSTNTISAPTSTLIPLTPVIFGGNIFDAALTANTIYYISNIVDSGNFNITNYIIRATATSTAYNTNLIQMSASVASFVVGQPIIFSGIAAGTTFGNIVPETVYYIFTTNTSTNQIVISADKINQFALTTASGNVQAKTCPTPMVVGGGSGSMTVSSTGSKLVVSNSIGIIGTMNATFSTKLFGGINSYTIYYITAITPGATPTVSVSTSLGGTPITLANGLGTMQMGASGWDNIVPGTASTTVDTTSNYYIEPKTVFSTPSNSQTTGTVGTPLAGGTTWSGIAYGNNYFLAVPTAGATGAISTNGITWASMTLPSNVNSWTRIAFGNFYWIALGITSGGTSVAAYSNSNGIGWRTTNMPANITWSHIVYGNGVFVAIASGTTQAAYTTNFGSTWTSSSTGILAVKTWVSLTYGTGLFMAVASDGTGAWSYDGNTWQATTLPQNSTTLSGVTITGGAGTLSFTTNPQQLVVGQTVVISGTNTGTGAITNGTYYISATNGSTSCTLSSTYPSITAITTTSGTPVGLTFTVGAPVYTSVVFGAGRFVAVQNGIGLRSAYSYDGITWYQSLTYMSATSVAYGQGVFVAVSSSSGTGYKSRSGQYWVTRSYTNIGYTAICFGFSTANVGVFATLAGTGSANGIYEGLKTEGRATVTSGTIVKVSLWEPGSNYTSAPTATFTDFNASITALMAPRISNGVLGNPTFISKGSGYNTNSTTVTITGNGYADTYQTGYTLVVNNLSSLPLVGSNLSITGNSQVYKVTSATAVYGTSAPFIEANIQISPNMTTALSPANGAIISLRQLYSQCRLTNHDFLSIGTGNRANTNYPYVDETKALVGNEAVETNQGHVFYVSTDENGDFQVGSLFGVQQSTGTVTLSATQFGVQGLQTLSLGGIALGGNQVVVTQFSTDPTFVANSDAIIPTQRAIKSYLTGRLSQGGSNTYTGAFTAGTITVGGANFIKSTVANGVPGSVVKMKNKVYFGIVPGSSATTGVTLTSAAVDGGFRAMQMFLSAGNHKTDTQQVRNGS